jgi:hypothetical protein
MVCRPSPAFRVFLPSTVRMLGTERQATYMEHQLLTDCQWVLMFGWQQLLKHVPNSQLMFPTPNSQLTK